MPASMLDLLIWAQVGGPGGMRPRPGFPNAGGAPPGMPDTGAMMAILAVQLILGFIFLVIMVVAQWKIYAKAGEPGWTAIVPIYNVMILSKICGRGEMFGLLVLVPCVGAIVAIMLLFDLAKVFGKGAGFAIGMLLLPFVFYPMLAFGSAEYVGPDGDTGRRRRRRDEDDEDEEDERPRRRRIAEEDEERPRRPASQDERVQRRPPPADRPKKRPADEDDEEEERPRRRDR